MKEAAGEANMTVITIILIGVVLAIGAVVITGVMNGTGKRACEAAGGTWVQDTSANSGITSGSNINAGGNTGHCDYN